MYVFVKPKQKPTETPFDLTEHFEWHENFELPGQCRITVLNIENAHQMTDDNCCKNLNVFGDDKCDDAKLLNDKTWTGEVNMVNETNKNGFYECKISIKGFKDQLIKGKSIWTTQ